MSIAVAARRVRYDDAHRLLRRPAVILSRTLHLKRQRGCNRQRQTSQLSAHKHRLPSLVRISLKSIKASNFIRPNINAMILRYYRQETSLDSLHD